MTGECEVVRLEDGRTVLLHGGPLTDEDRQHLQAIVDALPPIPPEVAERQAVMRKRNHERLVRLGLADA